MNPWIGTSGSRASGRGDQISGGRTPTGVQGQNPGQRDKVDDSLISDTKFLSKLSHKFGKFRLHGQRVSMYAPAYNGQGDEATPCLYSYRLQ